MYPALESESAGINLFSHGCEFLGCASQKPASLKWVQEVEDLLTSTVASFPESYL